MLFRWLLLLAVALGCADADAASRLVRGDRGLATVDFAVNRTSGISPLYVIADTADATSYTTSAQTSLPFHEIEYTWTFGDGGTSGTGTWAYGTEPGVSSRNTASGPIAAHVYECSSASPQYSGGTCTYQLCVVADDLTSTGSKCRTITVTDPDFAAEFAGALTVCISNDTDHTGCPAGATQRSSVTALSQLNTDIVAGARRILFHRGHTFTTATTVIVCNSATVAAGSCTTGTGPGLIGAYGSGALPKFQATAAFPVTTGIAILEVSSRYGRNMADWRIQDIELDGTQTTTPKNVRGIYLGGTIDQLTLLRITATDLTTSIINSWNLLDIWNNDASASVRGHRMWDQLAIVDHVLVTPAHGCLNCAGSSTGSYGYGVFLTAERFAILGSNFDGQGSTTAGVTHRVRMEYATKGVIADNYIANPSSTSSHLLKIHSGDWTVGADPNDPAARIMPIGVTGSGDAGAGIGENRGAGVSRWLYIGKNKLDSNYVGYPISIGPHSDNIQNRIQDVIFERNWVRRTQASTVQDRIANFEARYLTARGNLFNTSLGPYRGGIWVGKRASGFANVELAADNVALYGNSLYGGPNVNGTAFFGIQIEAGSTNITTKDNLGYATAGSDVMFLGQAANTTCNNTGQVSTIGTDPLFAGALSATTGWAIQAGSPYKATGCAMPVRKDFNGTNRSKTVPSIGAVE